MCRVVEPFHPLFLSHEELARLLKHQLEGFEQTVAGVHKKWLGGWTKSKGATMEQRRQIYEICGGFPDWEKQRYNLKLHPEELEVESTLTFGIVKGRKPQ